MGPSSEIWVDLDMAHSKRERETDTHELSGWRTTERRERKGSERKGESVKHPLIHPLTQ